MLARDFEDFCDAWGEKDNEFFVVTADHNTGTYQLAKGPGARACISTCGTGLAYPDEKKADRYWPGDLVTWTP